MEAANRTHMRKTFLSILTGILTGTLVLGVAWATAGLIPISRTPSSEVTTSSVDGTARTAQEAPALDPSALAEGERLPGGTFLVGAHNASIAPKTVAEGGLWTPHDPANGF